MLFILDKYERPVAVLSNTSPKACGYYNDEHLEQVDGLLTYEFEVPTTHADSKEVQAEAFVLVRDLDRNLVQFKIKRVVESQRDGITTKIAYAENSAIDDIRGKVVRPYNLGSVGINIAAQHVLEGTGWELGTYEFAGLNSLDFTQYINGLKALHEVRDVFGAEIQYRVEFDGTRIKAKYVDLLLRRGQDTGKRFEYGKDLVGVTREEDTSELVTALVPVGASKNDGTRVDITGYVGYIDDYYKPQGVDFVEDVEALQQFGRNGKHIMDIFESNATTSTQLIKDGLEELKRRSKPRLTYTVSVLLLERLAELEHEKVRLGDTIVIKDTTFSPAIVLEARVLELSRSYTDPTQDSVVLGEFAPIFTDSRYEVDQLKAKINAQEGVWSAKAETVYKSPTEPTEKTKDMLWLDLSLVPNVLKRWDEGTSAWVKVTPTAASEVGAETPTGAQSKANTAKTEAISTAATDATTKANNAKDEAVIVASGDATTKMNQAKTYAEGKASEAETAAKAYADGIAVTVEADANAHAEAQAQAAEDAAKVYTQSYAEKAIHIATTAPTDKYKLWLDTTNALNVLKRYDFANNKWVKATPTTAAEIGAETPSGAALKASEAEARAKAHADTAASDAETAAKTFATAEADAKRIEAEAYADGKITEEEEARIAEAAANLTAAKNDAATKANAAEAAAKTYAETQAAAAQQAAIDAAALDATSKANAAQAAAVTEANAEAALVEERANAYADGIVSDEEQARIDQAAANLATAKADAQAKADAAKTAAINAAKTDAQTKADAAKAAAISAANAETALAEARANAYADGVVSDEEQARIDQAAANLATAKADATSKANAAETAAKNAAALDATTKANNAKSEAISAAALDAQTKADAAEAAAKTHAEAKATAAQTAAEAYADGVVTDEEAARIAAVNQAVIDAAADAKAKADAAKAAAITAAASDATSKANAAQQAAITAGQNAANAAQTAAEDYADGVAQSEADAAKTSAISSANSYTQGYAEKAIHVGTTAPTDTGKLWLDTSTTVAILKKYVSGAWKKATPTAASEVGAETPTGAQSKADAAKNTAITTAASDATTKANQAKTDAINAAKADATAKADAAQQAAIDAANAEAALVETRAKAYADGIVSDEEQARIDEAAANLATAKADAQTKANAAETAAKNAAAADATTKADNAKNAAISAAAADATTKANNAKSQAIAAAASDATTKANNAQAAAITAGQDAADAAEAAAKSHADSVAQSKADAAQSAAVSAANSYTQGYAEKTMHIGTTAPSDTGKLWLDTSTTVAVLKKYISGAWKKATPTTASEVGAETTAGAQAKADAAKTTAISTAASDASSKAGTAETNAKNFAKNASNIVSGTLDFNKLSVNSFMANNITGGTLDAAIVTVDNLSASVISTGVLDASLVTVNNLNASNISTGTLNAARIGANSITADKISVSSLSALTANLGTMTAGSIDASKVSVTNVNASNISTGTLSAARIGANTIDASKINVSNLAAINSNLGTLTAGTIDASKVTVNNLNADNITTGTLNAARVRIGAGTQFDPQYDTVGKNAYNSASIAQANLGKWYRIASNAGNRAAAKFILKDTTSGLHSTATFEAGIHYGKNPYINLLSFGSYGALAITKARIVYMSTYDNPFLEVFVPTQSRDVFLEYYISENIQTSGWDAVDWVEGAIPTGYTTFEVDLNANNTIGAKADDAKGKTDLWSYANTTEIDGGNIRTNTVTANSINVSTLSSLTANLGTVTAGTIDASTVSINNLSASIISTGVLNASLVTINNMNASNITTGTLNAARIGANTITSDKINVSTLSAISANLGTLTAGTIDASKVSVTNVNASNISTGTLSAARIGANSIDASKINVTSLAAITANLGAVTAGSIDASTVAINNLSASVIQTGVLDAAKVTVNNLSAARITSGTMSADRIYGGTINGNTVSVVNLNAGNIKSGTLNADLVTISNGKVTIDNTGVTVKDANFLVESDRGTKYSVAASKNHIADHSFEMVQGIYGSSPTLIGTNGVYRTVDTTVQNAQSHLAWHTVGQPYVSSAYNTDVQPVALFGAQSILTRWSNYVYQDLHSLTPNTTYTFSFHIRVPSGVTNGRPHVDVEFWYVDPSTGLDKQWTSYDYNYDFAVAQNIGYNQGQRLSFNFYVPNGFDQLSSEGSWVRIRLRSYNDSEWVEYDGVQLVSGSYAAPYNDETEVYYSLRGAVPFKTMDGINLNVSNRIDAANVAIYDNGIKMHASSYGSTILQDHANGNITLSAAGGDLYLGYYGSGVVRTQKQLDMYAGTRVKSGSVIVEGSGSVQSPLVYTGAVVFTSISSTPISSRGTLWYGNGYAGEGLYMRNSVGWTAIKV